MMASAQEAAMAASAAMAAAEDASGAASQALLVATMDARVLGVNAAAELFNASLAASAALGNV